MTSIVFLSAGLALLLAGCAFVVMAVYAYHATRDARRSELDGSPR